MGLLRNIITWAVGNYPAGASPWSGSVMRVQPANAYITPEATRPAETDNWVFGNIIDNLNAANSSLAGMYATNWPNWTVTDNSNLNGDYARVGGKGYSGITKLSRWIAVGGPGIPHSGSNTVSVVESDDGGNTFQDLNFPSTGFLVTASSTSAIGSVAGDGSGGTAFIYSDFTTAPAVRVAVRISGTWTGGVHLSGTSGFNNLYFDVTNNVYVFGDVVGLLTFPVASTTITTQTPFASPPDAGNLANALTSIIVNKGDGSGLAIPATQTSTPWQHCVIFASPTATATYGVFPMLVTDIVTAGDYSPGDGIFMVAKYDGSASTSFMTSVNGSTWATTAGTIAGEISFLACTAGRIWVAMNTSGQIWYSTDTGVTWQLSPVLLASNVQNLVGMISNETRNQLCAFGAFGYKNAALTTENRFAIASLISG